MAAVARDEDERSTKERLSHGPEDVPDAKAVVTNLFETVLCRLFLTCHE